MTCRPCREAGVLVEIPVSHMETVSVGTESKFRTRCPECDYVSEWFAAG